MRRVKVLSQWPQSFVTHRLFALVVLAYSSSWVLPRWRRFKVAWAMYRPNMSTSNRRRCSASSPTTCASFESSSEGESEVGMITAPRAFLSTPARARAARRDFRWISRWVNGSRLGSSTDLIGWRGARMSMYYRNTLCRTYSTTLCPRA